LRRCDEVRCSYASGPELTCDFCRSRRDKKEAAIEKAAKEESVFQQITFYRLNPLGVRGPKDTMVV